MLRLSASRLRSKALTCLLGFTAFGRKPKPPASQVAVYASFVIATYRKYASLLKTCAPCIWSFLLCRPPDSFLRDHHNWSFLILAPRRHSDQYFPVSSWTKERQRIRLWRIGSRIAVHGHAVINAYDTKSHSSRCGGDSPHPERAC